MYKLKIDGGNRLNGSLKISTSKNAILPILSACILIDDEVEILDFPHFSDCYAMLDILQNFGAKISFTKNSVIVNCKNINSYLVDTFLAEKMRSSFFTFGAILARVGKAVYSYPGGCNIGARPIDIHLKAFRELGVHIVERHGYIYAQKEQFFAKDIYLDFQSVGVTENVMMLCACLDGTTIVHNCAKEPEIVDLQNFLNLAGANISGAGTERIVIKGVNKLLHSVKYKCIGDRIIAGTYLIGAACTGGDITLKNVNFNHLQDVINKLSLSGCKIVKGNNYIQLKNDKKLQSLPYIQTMPYPFFPTDLQAQITAMQCISLGSSVVVENIFESRFNYVPQLVKMGANIKVKNNIAMITGVDTLYGADVFATDLRAGASLVIAGLCAKGYTTVYNVHYIDRGYDSIESDLSCLGAKIIREKKE